HDDAPALLDPLLHEAREARTRPIEDPATDGVKGEDGRNADKGVRPTRTVDHTQNDVAAPGIREADRSIGEYPQRLLRTRRRLLEVERIGLEVGSGRTESDACQCRIDGSPERTHELMLTDRGAGPRANQLAVS